MSTTENLNTGLVLHLSGDISGSTAYDASGSGNNGTTNAITTQRNNTKKSFVLNGSSSYINMGNKTNFERTDSFSVSAWVKGSVNGYNTILGKVTGSTTYRGWYLTTVDSGTGMGALRMDFFNDNATNNKIGARGSVVITDGKWHHVVMTYSGTSSIAGIKFYVDGVPDTTTDLLGTTLSGTIQNTANLEAGARTESIHFFNGNIANERLYSRVLTPEEIRQIYYSEFIK